MLIDIHNNALKIRKKRHIVLIKITALYIACNTVKFSFTKFKGIVMISTLHSPQYPYLIKFSRNTQLHEYSFINICRR